MVAECLEWAARGRSLSDDPAPSGDRSLVHLHPGGALLAVVDGLGHGPDAAAAAETAVFSLRQTPERRPTELLERCHRALRATRGAVASLAVFDARTAHLTWSGVGNVFGMLARAAPRGAPARESLRTAPGVLGYRMHRPRAVRLEVSEGDLLVLATDGLAQLPGDALRPELPPELLATELLLRFGRPQDDAEVLVARLHPLPRPSSERTPG